MCILHAPSSLQVSHGLGRFGQSAAWAHGNFRQGFGGMTVQDTSTQPQHQDQFIFFLQDVEYVMRIPKSSIIYQLRIPTAIFNPCFVSVFPLGAASFLCRWASPYAKLLWTLAARRHAALHRGGVGWSWAFWHLDCDGKRVDGMAPSLFGDLPLDALDGSWCLEVWCFWVTML